MVGYNKCRKSFGRKTNEVVVNFNRSLNCFAIVENQIPSSNLKMEMYALLASIWKKKRMKQLDVEVSTPANDSQICN